MVDFIFRNGKQVAMTSDEIAERDYLAFSDNVMSEEMKTYRKNLRNIPQDYSADKYNDLFAKDEQGKLTHSVWSKP